MRERERERTSVLHLHTLSHGLLESLVFKKLHKRLAIANDVEPFLWHVPEQSAPDSVSSCS